MVKYQLTHTLIYEQVHTQYIVSQKVATIQVYELLCPVFSPHEIPQKVLLLTYKNTRLVQVLYLFHKDSTDSVVQLERSVTWTLVVPNFRC